MVSVRFLKHAFVCKEQESLLEAFFRNKIDAPFSCRNGTCHTCLMQIVSGSINAESQDGLDKDLVQTGHFLPCKCYPLSDIVLTHASDENVFFEAKIVKLEKLSTHITEVSLKPVDSLFAYKTGQFINIRFDQDDKQRSYSLSSSFNKDDVLKIHVQKIAGGLFSNWIFNSAKLSDKLKIRYPLGNCFASDDLAVSGKLMIATGSGLGAVVAIAQSALNLNYRGEIHLFHGASDKSRLYLQSHLSALMKKHPNFHYYSCRSEKTAFQKVAVTDSWEVYLYGNPAMVESASTMALNSGVPDENIFCDAFKHGMSLQNNDLNIDEMEFIEEEKRTFDPDPKMWEALGSGDLLRKILNDFYDKVLVDSLLSPYFKGVTKAHIIGKQYAFLNQVYTGRDTYFGDRPRNAHHWMVISNSLFDHRERLFAASCVKYGLKDPFLKQILDLNETYRKVIVKSRMWSRINKGVLVPLKGYDEMILDIGGICDGCECVLNPGEKVHYHGQTGEMFCQKCHKH